MSHPALFRSSRARHQEFDIIRVGGDGDRGGRVRDYGWGVHGRGNDLGIASRGQNRSRRRQSALTSGPEMARTDVRATGGGVMRGAVEGVDLGRMVGREDHFMRPYASAVQVPSISRRYPGMKKASNCARYG